MEKISFIRDAQVGPEGYAYRASEVDALISDVRSLVEAGKKYADTPIADEITKRLALHDLRLAISAVEARMKL